MNLAAAAEELLGHDVCQTLSKFWRLLCQKRLWLEYDLSGPGSGEKMKPRQVIDDAIGFLLKAGNTTQLPLIQALQAEIALQQGNLPVANQWARQVSHQIFR